MKKTINKLREAIEELETYQMLNASLSLSKLEQIDIIDTEIETIITQLEDLEKWR